MPIKTLVSLICLGLACYANAAEEPTFYGRNVEEWTKIVRQKGHPDRREAFQILAEFGPAAKSAVPDLLRILNDKTDSDFERGAIEALSWIDPEAPGIVPPLIRVFMKEGRILGETGTILINASHPVYTLERIGGPAVPALVELLGGKDKKMRPIAAHLLYDIGPAAAPAVPALLRVLRLDDDGEFGDEPSILRGWAIGALRRIGPSAGEAIPYLRKLLNQYKDGETGDDLGNLVSALAKIGYSPVPDLLEILRNGKAESGYELALLGPQAKIAVPELRELLHDKRPRIRHVSAVVLAMIDPTAIDALPFILESLEDEEYVNYLQDRALASLGVGARSSIPQLNSLTLKGDGDWDYVRVLPLLDPGGAECLPTLIRALERDDSYVNDNAAEAVSLLGPRAKSAVPALSAILSRRYGDPFSNYNPRVSAARALSRIGPDAREAIPALIKATTPMKLESDRDSAPRDELDVDAAMSAAEALGAMTSDEDVVVPALIRVLESDGGRNNHRTREAAARSLGRFGPAARKAVPALKKTVAQNDEWLAYASISALMHIDQTIQDFGRSLATRADDPARHWKHEYKMHIPPLIAATGAPSFEAKRFASRDLTEIDNVVSWVEFSNDTQFAEDWFRALSRFGPAARFAVPRLRELTTHRNPWIRLWAKEAIEEIMPGPAAPRKSMPG